MCILLCKLGSDCVRVGVALFSLHRFIGESRRLRTFVWGKDISNLCKGINLFAEGHTQNQIQNQKCHLATEFGRYSSHKTVSPTACWISDKYTDLCVLRRQSFLVLNTPVMEHGLEEWCSSVLCWALLRCSLRWLYFLCRFGIFICL